MNATRPILIKRLLGPLIRPIVQFIQTEALSGLLLFGSSALALLLANLDIGIARHFPAIWESTLSLAVNTFVLEKSLSHWINDGLMALFFLVVGLEIKREVLEGELASWRQAALPLVSALGGMLAPALLYMALNAGQPTSSGWGIPMATDIAFALAVLHLLGRRVPTSIKVFVTALAIADDLGAVLVIALFYTADLNLAYLAWAGGILALLMLLNGLRVRSLPVYLLLGLGLWYVTLKSGIHATVAGVLLAFTIPFRIRYTDDQLVEVVQDRLRIIRRNMSQGEVNPQQISEELETLSHHISSPAQRLENALHGPIAYVVIPVFAFCNTSLVIDPALMGQLTTPLALGIMAGLVLGKPLGILLLSYGAVRLGWAGLPSGVGWRQMAGAACLAGIGFTMSIFISLLAFEQQAESQSVAKLAILLASLVAGGAGYALLRFGPELPAEETELIEVEEPLESS